MAGLSVPQGKDNDMLNRIVELSLLFDFYGPLLKDTKRQIFEDYILNDLSLGEIASDKSISRQAVFDMVKRCSKELEEYEEKLCLIQKFNQIKLRINEIHTMTSKIKESGNSEGIGQIELLLNEILDVL